MAAAIAMLDERHQPLQNHPSDANTYVLGRIGDHDVVIACLPAGQTGKASAASVAAQIRFTFGGIRMGLLVGIGGGVPSAEHDIRLGDVVVSQPGIRNGGIVQYDFGKTVEDGKFVQTGSMNKPPPILLSAVSVLQADEKVQGEKISTILEASTSQQLRDENFVHQGQENDLLFQSDYEHPKGRMTCHSCDVGKMIKRQIRDGIGVKVFYGTIATADQVMRHANTRDRIAKEHGVLCFEMEAAGVDDFPCLVLRGVCDYADSHKNKRWQEYAALTAAAYAKSLLAVVSHWNVNETRTESPFPLLDPMESLALFPESHRIRIPDRYSVQKMITRKSDWWFQGYWHSPFILRPPSSADAFNMSIEIQDHKKQLQQLSPPPPSNSDSLETKLSRLMYEYRELISDNLCLFPHPGEQNRVFKSMMRAAGGLIEKDMETARTLLHYMAMSGVSDVLPLMVEAGFDVDTGDSDRRTPLHLAVVSNHASSVRALIEDCGANVHAQDLFGALPWHLALVIDAEYAYEHPIREASKEEIIRCLAQHTKVEEVRTTGPREALKKLKENPSADIIVSPIQVIPRYQRR